MNISIDAFRQQILSVGFAEATERPRYFWKILTEKTAFILNLKQLCDGVGVVYGVMSTAVLWTEGDWNYFRQFGCGDDDCNLRFYLEIRSEGDEAAARDAVSGLYGEYLHVEKDALLAVVKDRRKQFIQQIHNVLKPLGFRKKGNQWRKALTKDVYIRFWADKSTFADLYYFSVDVFCLIPPNGLCCDMRMDTRGTDIFDWRNYSTPHHRFDWQLQSTEALLEIVNRAYEEEMRPFIENGLEYMGKQPSVWKRCTCNRKCCPSCWVEKNLWEAKENG